MQSDLPATDLFARCVAGDATAWEEFRQRYGRLIIGTIVREADVFSVRNEEDLADLEQGFYLKLLDRSYHVLRSFEWRGDASDFRYLKTVARFYVRDRMSSWRESVPLPAADIPEQTIDLSVQIDLNRITRFVREEFSTRDYWIFRLRFFVGLTGKQIAGLSSVGLGESGVEVVIRKIVHRLRWQFTRRQASGGVGRSS